MSQNKKLRKLFIEQFGRRPTKQEILMLHKEHMSKALFQEWLCRKFGTQVSASQETRFVRKFKENKGLHWNRFDIFWREVNAQNPQEALRVFEEIKDTLVAVREERQDFASLRVATTTTSITGGVAISGKHSGAQQRRTENTAIRGI